MKVNVDMTVEVSDEARKKIASLLGQKEVDRQGIKDFLWRYGERWEYVINGQDEPDEDLLGGEPEEDLLGSSIEEDLLGTVDEDLL